MKRTDYEKMIDNAIERIDTLKRLKNLNLLK